MAETGNDVVPLAPPSTRETILTTALRLFSEQGYDGTSLRRIADSVGTTKAAVYYHFPAKEHLLLELTKPMIEDLSALVTEARARVAAGDGTQATPTLEAYVDLFLGHLPVVHLLARDPATQNHPDIGQRLRSLVEALQRLLAGADAEEQQLVRSACALGTVHAVSTMPAPMAHANRGAILEAALAALGPGSGPDERRGQA